MSHPIINRELVASLRSRKAVVVQTLLALALTALVAARYPGLTDTAGAGGSTADVGGQAARQLLRVFSYGLMVGLMLLAPVFAATSVVKERVGGTLALLLHAPITAGSIVLGKLAATMGYVGLLIVLSLPAAAVCWAMGGVSLWGQLGAIYLVLVVMALQYAAVGLWVSSRARTVDGSLRWTYGLILLLAVGVLAPQALLGSTLDQDAMLNTLSERVPAVGPLLSQILGAIFGVLATVGLSLPVVIDWLRSLSPVPAIASLLGEASAGGGEGVIERGLALRYVITAVLITVVLIGWSVLRLHPRMLDRSRSAGKVTNEQNIGTQAYRRVMYLWFFDPKRRGDAIGVHWAPIALSAAAMLAAAYGARHLWLKGVAAEDDPRTARAGAEEGGLMIGGFDLAGQAGAVLLGGLAVIAALVLLTTSAGANPVAVKEQRTRKLGRGNWMARIFGATLIGSLALMLAATGSSTARLGGGLGGLDSISNLGGIIAVLQVGLILLLTPALASGLISTERESRGWQLLQMTPMSVVSIVGGKLLSVVVLLALVLIATLPAYAVLIYVRPELSGVVRDVVITLVITSGMCLMVSAACSAVAPRTAMATVSAYIILLTLGVGTLLLWVGENAPFPTELVRHGLMVNPLAICLSAMGTLDFDRYQLLPTAWWVMGGVTALALIVLIIEVWRLTRPR